MHESPNLLKNTMRQVHGEEYTLCLSPQMLVLKTCKMHLMPVIQYIMHFITLHLQVTHYVSIVSQFNFQMAVSKMLTNSISQCTRTQMRLTQGKRVSGCW